MSLGLKEEDWNVLYRTGVVFNIISVIGSAFILITLIILAFYDHRKVNRISLRLQAGVALVDIVNHINNIYHWVLPEGPLCQFNGFIRIFGRQLYCFFNIAIALNLQLIFIQGLHPRARWELYYWAVPIVLATVMNLPPLILGMFGHSVYRCLLKENTGYDNGLLITINLTLLMIITFGYCIFVATLVMIKLKSNLAIVKSIAPYRNVMNPEHNSRVEKNIRRLIFRVSLYPIACVCSMFGYCIVNIMYIFRKDNPTISAIALINLTLTGTLNFIAFILDPTFHSALSFFWAEMKSPAAHKEIQDIVILQDPLHHIELSDATSSDELTIHYANNLHLL